MNFNRPKPLPIGLDIGHDSIKMMQLQVTGVPSDDPADGNRSLAVVAAAKCPISEEAKKDPEHRAAISADLIRRMLTQQPFVGRRVVTSLPRELVHVKNLRLPPIPAAELEAAVQFEARTVFPFDTEDARIQFLPAGEVRQGNENRQEVIVLAVKNSDIHAYLEQLDQSGLRVDSLDTEITGLYRTLERFGRRREDDQQINVLVDIGARRTQVIIGKGRSISFYKPVDIGGLHLLDVVARKLGITIEEARALRQRLLDSGGEETEPAKKDPVRQAVFDATRSVAEELGKELAMCLRYYSVTFRGHRPASVRVVGGEAADPQLRAVFKSILGIPVEAARPLFSVDTANMRSADRQGSMSGWALAMGLGLRFTTGHFSAKDGMPRALTAPLSMIAEATLVEPKQSPFGALIESGVAVA